MTRPIPLEGQTRKQLYQTALAQEDTIVRLRALIKEWVAAQDQYARSNEAWRRVDDACFALRVEANR